MLAEYKLSIRRFVRRFVVKDVRSIAFAIFQNYPAQFGIRRKPMSRRCQPICAQSSSVLPSRSITLKISAKKPVKATAGSRRRWISDDRVAFRDGHELLLDCAQRTITGIC